MPGPPGLPNLAAMRGRRKGGRPAPAKSTPAGLAACASAFLDHLAARAYSQGSLDAHRWALGQFTTWAADTGRSDPAALTRADLEAYQFHLHHYRSPRGGRPLVGNTQLARLGCVRRLFAWLCRSNAIPANPAADLDLPRKQARRLPKALDPAEIQRLLAIPNPADPFGLRDRTILELFYATGIRRTEMTKLDHGDYDSAARTLLVRQGKGGKSRLLPVGERAAAWLDRYLAESRPLFEHLPAETAMFLSGYGTRITPAYLGTWVKSLHKRCGIDKPGSCHVFRHSCATDMHRGGADIRHVQEMLGHARLETTQIYTHVNIATLTEVHARTHPHGTIPPGSDIYGTVPPNPHATDAAPAAKDLPASPQAALSDTTASAQADFPSAPPADLVKPATVMAVCEPKSGSTSTALLPRDQLRPDRGPEDDPPAGTARKPRPAPPRGSGGGVSRNPLPSRGLRPTRPCGPKGCIPDYGYRFYDPVTGRWPSRDPIGDEALYRRFVQGMSQSERVQIARRRLDPLYLMVGNDLVSRWDLLGLCDCGKIQIREIGGALGGGGSDGTDWLLRPKYWNKGKWKDALPDPDASLNLPRSATATFQIQVVDSTCDEVQMTVKHEPQRADEENVFVKFNNKYQTRDLGDVKNKPKIFAGIDPKGNPSSILHPTTYPIPGQGEKTVNIRAVGTGYKGGDICCTVEAKL